MEYHATCAHAPTSSKMPQRSDVENYVKITHTQIPNGKYTAQVWACSNHDCGYGGCRCNQGDGKPFNIIGQVQ